MRRHFEWFVAWRHLRDPTPRWPRTLVVGVVFVALGFAGLHVVSHLEAETLAAGTFPSYGRLRLLGHARTACAAVLGLGGLLAYIGVLFRVFTVFTALSIFGVFLGTCAPIEALSVMSGFEADLTEKIRSSKADVVVELPDQSAFTEWAPLAQSLLEIDGVEAVTPYLEAEVMLLAGSSMGSAVIRGIIPEQADAVLDLKGKLKAGDIADLADAPSAAKFKRRTVWDVATESGSGSGPNSEPAETDSELASARSGKAVSDPVIEPEEPEPAAKRADNSVGARSGGPGKESPRETEGSPDAETDRFPGLILGKELYSSTLRLFQGDTVDIVCPLCGFGPNGPMPKSRTFRVVGHFYTGMYEFDARLGYVSLAEAQRFLDLPDAVSGINVRTSSGVEAPVIADEIEQLLKARKGVPAGNPDQAPPSTEFTVRSWEDSNQALFRALKLEKIAMFVALAFILVVASFSIVSNLFMQVTEKGREVAMLKSMGASNNAILRLFVFQGLYIGLLGMFTGLVAGVGACFAMSRYGLPLPEDLYYIHELPVAMRLWEIVLISAVALGLSCVGAVFPAFRAARQHPVDGLRYE